MTPPNKKQPPGATIGILGGGQLGRMLAIAAAQLGFRCNVFSSEENAPAYDVAASYHIADYSDHSALYKFAQETDVVTYEFENVPVSTLEYLETQHKCVFPSSAALKIIQDRLLEKTFITDLDIPVAPFRNVENISDLQKAAKELGLPAVLKTRRFGYDGKGQVKLNATTPLDIAYEKIGHQPAILEALIPFEKELSIIALRDQKGNFASYDVSENVHKNQILSTSTVPADVPEAINESARHIAQRIADKFQYVGAFAVELFYMGQAHTTPLMVNEIAPRVHNTGHWTLNACTVSQFENHIRAIAGWPLASTERHSDAVMTNLIGMDFETWLDWAQQKNTSLHLYRKTEIRPGRKMGHVTTLKNKEE